MHANDLTDRWVAKTLTREQIYDYLVNDVIGMGGREMSVSNLQHVAECCHHLYQWATHQLPSVGNFLTAVIANDLMKSIQYADETNRDLLWVYVIFMYNVAPSGWRERDGQ